MRKQTLKEATRLVRTSQGLHDVTRSGLGGCPEGGWPETQQAKRRLEDALPHRSERTYTACEIIDALYTVNNMGRYEYRVEE